MKTIATYIALICFFAFAKAQNETSKEEIKHTVEIKLGVGESQKINDIKITFLRVIEDSRCPKDVDCVWAGQAKIRILGEENGIDPVEKELTFSSPAKTIYIHKSDVLAIKAVRLSPYPETSLATSKRVYYLELQG